MSPTRREFIKNVGITVASLVAARCACIWPRSTDQSPRGRVRSCWQRFDWLAEEAQHWDDPERGDEARVGLITDHRAALDELVAAGELKADVADLVQEAYNEAAHHIWRANCGMTCYEPVPRPDYAATSGAQLVRQAEVLAELADDESIDPQVMARNQAAIEHEMAFVGLTDGETEALYDALDAAAGGSYNYPTFDKLDLEITSEAAEAARFLVELLLEEPE